MLFMFHIATHNWMPHTHKPLVSVGHTALPWLSLLGIPKISPPSRMWSHGNCNIMVQQWK